MHEELQLSAMKQAMDEEKIKLVDEKKMDLEKKRLVINFHSDFEISS